MANNGEAQLREVNRYAVLRFKKIVREGLIDLATYRQEFQNTSITLSSIECRHIG
jgi:hypothetical protein